MTRTEQARSLLATISDTSLSVVTRRQAAESLVDLKKAARVSFARLGVDEAELTQAVASMEEVKETPTPVTADKPKRDERREQVIALLKEVADKPRKEQVKYLMEKLNINANSAYYFARTCQ